MWLKERRARLSAKSCLSEKPAYIARHQDGLRVFLDDGRVEMDSNSAEKPDPPGCSEPQECVGRRPRRRDSGLGPHRLADRNRQASEPCACLNLPANDGRIAKAVQEHPAPTLEQIWHVLDTIPASSDIELRDRILIASTILTGARDNAIVSLSLRLARSLLIGTLSGRLST